MLQLLFIMQMLKISLVLGELPDKFGMLWKLPGPEKKSH